MPYLTMTVRRPTLPLGLLAFAALAAACGVEKKGKSYLPAYVVNGDPNNLIRNTLPRTTSPFTKANAGQFTNYFPARANEFVKRTRNAGGKSQREIEEDSRSVSGNGGSAFYRFVDKGAGVWSFEAENGAPAFTFRESASGALNLEAYAGEPVKPVHYSLREDNAVFSLLFRASEGTDDESLVAYYFANGNETPSPLADIDPKFVTLLGEGKTVRWEQDIGVTLCDGVTADLSIPVTQAVNLWLEDGKIGPRALKVESKTQCPPFTDVKEHDIVLVDDYIVDDSTEYATLGLTIPAINNSRRLLMSDVLIFMQPHKRIFGSDANGKYLRGTIAHEFGHFLGLGHVFQKDGQGKPLYDSVMSYEQVLEPTAFDHEAIRALYGR